MCRSAGILYEEMQPDEKPPVGRRMGPFGIWRDQLGPVQTPNGKCGRKLSLIHGVPELVFGKMHRGAWHDVFSGCLWGKAASLTAMCFCLRPYFKVQPGLLVFAFLLLNSNYPKG